MERWIPSGDAVSRRQLRRAVVAENGTISRRQVRRLRAAILADLEPEIHLALEVAVLLAAGHKSRTQIGRQLRVTPKEMSAAVGMVRRAATRLDAGDASAPGS
jgi:hypothetical protein